MFCDIDGCLYGRKFIIVCFIGVFCVGCWDDLLVY